MSREIIAHITNDGRTQLLIEHLINVGDKSAEFAREFDEEKLARTIGIYHDIGKATIECQNRLYNHGAGALVDHSTPSAKFLLNETGNYTITDINKNTKNTIVAMCIMSHHTGLVNRNNDIEQGSYNTRLNKKTCKIINDLGLTNIIDKSFSILPKNVNNINNEQVANNNFYCYLRLKMLFSCLVDADFLDTENFMKNGQNRSGFDSISYLKYKMDNYLIDNNRFNPNNAFNKKRSELLKNCILVGDNTEKNLLSLTMPTGSGKTESSLALALHLAERKLRKRIIYVIPYTSIIQQNAKVFKNILGEKNVVEHHSNVEFDDSEEGADIRKLATENWDAPIIVTTNVQFFESLYGNKTSKCRKLHNIVNSVIIFDEAQMLPVNYLKPCMKMVEELVMNYKCTAILCTATQPSLSKFFTRETITEISKNPKQDYLDFKRTNTSFKKGMITKKDLALELSKKRKVLCICNTIKDTKEIYDLIDSPNKYCLTTHLYPKHREEVIEQIKSEMYNVDDCIVIATSLVEAGVNLDFPYVYREIAGVDNIIQSAGRCNREKKFNSGDVIVFKLQDGIKGILEPNINSTKNVCLMVEKNKLDSIDSPEGIKMYFDNLHNLKKGQDAFDLHHVYGDATSSRKCQCYKTIAENFKLIENNSKSIFVPINQEANDLLQKLKNSTSNFIDRDLIRHIMKYTISLRYNDDPLGKAKPFDKVYAKNVLEKVTDELYVLTDLSQYDLKKGLII